MPQLETRYDLTHRTDIARVRSNADEPWQQWVNISRETLVKLEPIMLEMNIADIPGMEYRISTIAPIVFNISDEQYQTVKEMLT